MCVCIYNFIYLNTQNSEHLSLLLIFWEVKELT